MRRAKMDDLADVNRWVSRDLGVPVDFSEFIANPLHVCLLHGEGGAMFAWRGPGIYEAHAFFEQRGLEVLRLSQAMIEAMRREYGARYFWSLVPVSTRHARLYCRLLGWKSAGIVKPPQGESEIFVSENFPCLQS